jgi:5'-3' exonuclease
MILLVDADSLVYASCCKKRETPEDDYHQTDLCEARNKFDEQYMSIVNTLEEMYTIEKVITFNGSRGNFRHFIGNKYKENRSEYKRPPLLFEMHDYVKSQYDSIVGYGVETDDMVAKYWKKLSGEIGRSNVMIKITNNSLAYYTTTIISTERSTTFQRSRLCIIFTSR